jgi:hypothetical protein
MMEQSSSAPNSLGYLPDKIWSLAYLLFVFVFEVTGSYVETVLTILILNL